MTESTIPDCIALATCFHQCCSKKAVGMKSIGKNAEAAFCEDHLEEE